MNKGLFTVNSFTQHIMSTFQQKTTRDIWKAKDTAEEIEQASEPVRYSRDFGIIRLNIKIKETKKNYD